MMRHIIRGFFCNREIGSGTYGRTAANKMWMSREFFLLSGIFPLKNRKSLPKNFTEKLRRVRSQFVIGSVGLALLASPSPLLANKRHGGRDAGNSALPPLEVVSN